MIRKAEKTDIPALARLLHQVQNVHAAGRPDLFVPGMRKYTDEQLEALLADDRRPVFVYDDGGVEGYIFCVVLKSHSPSQPPFTTLFIDDLCVDEASRRKGVGRALFDYAKEYARGIGCHNLTLNVWECNPGAKEFYEKMGMRVQKYGMETAL